MIDNDYWDADMPELFEKARRENLWFNCTYQNLWFTPDELEQLHKEGKFRWGAVNWRLLSPTVRVKEIEKRIRTFQKELASVKKKMGDIG